MDPADSALRNAQLAGDTDPYALGAIDPAADFLDTVLDALTDGVLACSRSGVPIVVNRAARAFYEAVAGRPWDDHGGRSWLDELVSAATSRETARRGVLARDLRDVELTVTGVAAEHAVRLTRTPVASSFGPPVGYVVTLRDESRQKAEERRLALEGTYDAVTGLPTRPVVMRRVQDALANPASRPVALLFADVDRMRDVNDRHGYPAGDRFLRALARDLRDAVDEDGWVGHLGSDQFVVLVTGKPSQPYAALADRIRSTVARPRCVTPENDEIAVTASIGIAVTEDANGGAPGLLHEAELAMRHAQSARPGGVATFARDMRGDPAERMLMDAIRNGELVLHYQPKVDLASDRIVAFEALVRWERPDRGLVPPSEFIPLAESTGLIVELGTWVLRTACVEVARWQERFPSPTPLRVCVNASPRQFEAGISDVVRGALVASGIPPESLCLEVTETAIMRDVDAASRTLSTLRDLGVGVSIDDFGTGYSSLAYLRRLPVDELKIDKTFVDGLGSDTEDSALVAGIVSLAHALDLSVVAEGVETEVQLEQLRRIGCEIGQGYLFSRPLPGPAVIELLERGGELRRPVVEPAGVPTIDGALENDRVVVADDAADVLMLARLSLTSAGFDVMEASDGKAAIEAVQRSRPSCVVLDVAMPGMDGLDVCRALRADPVTADCTIVMLTATDTASDKIAAFAAGADDYIVKPFSPRDLVGRLRSADRRRHGARLAVARDSAS